MCLNAWQLGLNDKYFIARNTTMTTEIPELQNFILDSNFKSSFYKKVNKYTLYCSYISSCLFFLFLRRHQIFKKF